MRDSVSIERRHRRRLAAVVGLGSLCILAGGGLALSSAATAALVDVPVMNTPGRLVLASDPYPAEFLNLSPGAPAHWLVAARVEGAERATLTMELRKDGELVSHPRGLVMSVDTCDEQWTGLGDEPVCATGASAVTTATPADDYRSSSPTFDLEPLVTGAPEYLLITLSVEDSAAASADASLMGLTGDMGVGLTATAFDDITVPVRPSGPDGLAGTGVDATSLFAVVAIAMGAIGIGWALRLRRGGEGA